MGVSLSFVLVWALPCSSGSLHSSVGFSVWVDGKIGPILCIKACFQLLRAADGPVAAGKNSLHLSLLSPRHFRLGSM